MAKEHWYFVAGMLLILVPLLLFLAVKKLHLLEAHPDEKIVYTTNSQSALTLHAFPAKNRTTEYPAPALLLFHGGSWLYGGPESMYPQCMYFSERGFSCFTAEYRLGENGIPDVRGALADARAAFDYLLENAERLNIDPAQIIVGGGSSGGHLAAALGAGLPDQPSSATGASPRPAALVLYNPMLDLAPGMPDHHLVKDYWEHISPYQHIDGKMPPVLILVGSQDLEVPVPTAQDFCKKMLNKGGRCELAVYHGQGHGFYHKPTYREQTGQRILKFLATQKI